MDMGENKKTSDYLIRVISAEANVIGLACISTATVNEACALHKTSPAASAALGRALTGTLLMGALVKKGQRVGIMVDGGGPIGKLITEANSDGAVCGFATNPAADAPLREGKLDVSGVVGNAGSLKVFKDVGIDEPYQGIVKLRTGEIAEDLAYYFAVSEQIPTAVALGVYVETDNSVSAAGGLLIQSLPPSDENLTEKLVANIGKLRPLTESIRNGQLPEDILASIFSGIPFHILEKRGLRFQCKCGRHRIERVLISLGCDELKRMASKEEEVEVKCEFCGTAYSFSREQVDVLIGEMGCD
jgi:molecular chaperone Hsp33